MNKITKNILFWLVFVGTLSYIILPFNNKLMPIESQELSFSTFVDYVNDKQVKTVYLPRSGSEYSSRSFIVKGIFQNNKLFKTVVPDNDYEFIRRLIGNKVEIIVAYDSNMLQYIFLQLINLFPMLFIVGLVIYSLRQGKNGGNGGLGGGPFGFSKSKPKIFKPADNNITFEDVAGIDEAKQDLEEIVDFLRSPIKFQRLGGRIPRGVLLVGDPGNGKTLLAKAIANEAKVPFFSISGSDFVEVFVGVGASRVRRIFENAKKTSPCIIFIDEIDAVGKRRDMSLRGGNDEREQTLNQLLVEMDGFDENQGVIVIAATNRADILDPALLRPGRFDRTINVPYPDMKGREMILRVHSKKVPLAHDVDLKTIARGTPGFSGADLANLINESALLAARQNKLAVYMKDLEMAKDKIIMGSERKTLHMNDKERKLTAYHESGHAVMALISPQYDPIHKVTIVPRGGALGMVVSLPEDDKISVSRTELLSNIKVAMGGRASEEIFFGKENVTTGASNDIEKATKIARNMMLKWGMSDKLGFQAFFTSKYYDASDNLSQRTTEIIDKEVEELVKRLYEEVKTTLTENKENLERIANKLLEKETLTGIEVKQLFDNTYVDSPDNETLDNESNKLLDEFALGGLPNISLPDNSKAIENDNDTAIDTNNSDIDNKENNQSTDNNETNIIESNNDNHIVNNDDVKNCNRTEQNSESEINNNDINIVNETRNNDNQISNNNSLKDGNATEHNSEIHNNGNINGNNNNDINQDSKKSNIKENNIDNHSTIDGKNSITENVDNIDTNANEQYTNNKKNTEENNKDK